MRILRAGTYRRTPWKNGGGETSEIAVSPEGSGFDDFGWRVSMARVTRDGPFSAFPGVDRTLSVLEGEGIALDIAGQQSATLTIASDPLPFPADAATIGRLVDGPITDLNVMTRRGRFRHRVARHDIGGEIAPGVGAAVLFSASASLGLSGGVVERLGLYDAALMEVRERPVRIEGRGRWFVIELQELG
jgi:environmental stress-induced protein Ves